MFGIVLVKGCTKSQFILKQPLTYKEITEKQFRKKLDEGNFTGIVVFASEWTGGSTMLHSLMEKLARDYKATPIQFCSIDPEKEPKIAEEYRINGHLTVFFFRKSVLIDQVVGMPAKNLLRQKVEELIQSQ